MRSGSGKDKETVGCCSLRVQHISLFARKDGFRHVVSFNFLGKDSIPYVNKVSVDEIVYKNLEDFMRDKYPRDKLFDKLNVGIIIEYFL